MKKTSIFVVLIAFLASIFLVAFFGAQVIDAQFKAYVRSVEITTFTAKKPSSGEKYYTFMFEEGEDNFVNIDYEVTFSREGVSEEGLIEFVILSGNTTFEENGETYVIRVELEENGETYDTAVLKGRGNVLYFNAPGAVIVELRTTVEDGSGHRDTCQYICMSKEIEE